MKVCNLETIGTVEDAIRLIGYICAEAPQAVIVPSFSWIKNNLQEISAALFQSEHDKALKLAEELKSRCIEFVSVLVTEEKAATFAQEQLNIHFIRISELINSPLTQPDNHKLLAAGEYLSSMLIAAGLKAKGMDIALLESPEFMRVTDNKPDLETITTQVRLLTQRTHAAVYVLQSGLYQNASGEIEYIPNIAPDTYATYVAAAFHADELVLWSQIQGLYTTGDNTTCKPEENYTLTFEEAESFINAGACLLNQTCIELARQTGTSIKLVNDGNNHRKTFYIGSEQSGHKIKAVVARRHVSYIRLRSLGVVTSFQFLEKSLAVFSKYKVPVFLMTSSSTNISMAVEVSMDILHLIRHDVATFADMVVENNIATLCVLGQFNWGGSGIEGKIINLLKDIPILMISYGSENSSVSVAVREKDRTQALCFLADAFLGTDFKREDAACILREEYDAFIV